MNGYTEVILPLPPSDNTYWVRVKTNVFLSTHGRKYKALVKETWSARGYPAPLSGPVGVSVVIYRRRSGENAGDTTNYGKALFDAMEGCAYVNDKQVIRVTLDRFDDPSNPRVEVRIWPMDVDRDPVFVAAPLKEWQLLPPGDIAMLKRNGVFWELYPDAQR